MLFEQVQRVILAKKKYFGGRCTLKDSNGNQTKFLFIIEFLTNSTVLPSISANTIAAVVIYSVRAASSVFTRLSSAVVNI